MGHRQIQAAVWQIMTMEIGKEPPGGHYSSNLNRQIKNSEGGHVSRACVGMQTDIWSLGCVVYEMLMLRHAFQAASINKLAEKIVQGRQAPHSSIQSYPSIACC